RRLEAGGRGLVQVEELDIGPMPADSSSLIDAGVDEEPVEPGVETVGIAQRGQITPGPDERVLHGVPGPFEVPEDEPRGRVQPGDRGACQLGEGVMIAVPRSLHEVSLHLAPRRWRDRSATLREYGETRSPNRSDFR